MPQQIGRCGLCHEYPRELRKSHLIAAGIHRLLLNPERTNPNPVIMHDGKAVTSSEQISKHFLCADCEQRISRNGEDYVIPLCPQLSGDYPLRNRLMLMKPVEEYPTGDRVCDLWSLLEDDIEKIIYFAASVFWRAAATKWPYQGKRTQFIVLGDHLEGFRLFLVGRSELPSDSAINVVADACEPPEPFIIYPDSFAGEGCSIYHFRIPGLLFVLYTGPNIPKTFREGALNTSGRKLILLKDLRKTPLFDGLLDVMSKTKRVGKFKKKKPPSA